MGNRLIRNHLLASIAPALLVLIALFQHVAVFRYQLAPQRGGGFGMFSAIDSSRNRHLKVFVVADKQTYAVELPEALYDRALLAEALPTEAGLRQFAQIIARYPWVSDPHTPQWAHHARSYPLQSPLRLSKVRLEFWQTDMDHQARLSLKLSRLLEVEAQ